MWSFPSCHELGASRVRWMTKVYFVSRPRARRGIRESAATRRWRQHRYPRSLSAPRRPRGGSAAAGPRGQRVHPRPSLRPGTPVCDSGDPGVGCGPVLLITCLPPRGAANQESSFQPKLIHINKNADGIAGVRNMSKLTAPSLCWTFVFQVQAYSSWGS